MKFLNEVYTELLSEEVLDESTGKKNLYIKGVFAEADTKNRNGRIYPRKVMERGVNEYINEYVKPNRAIGEINHPDRLSIDPKEASHRITELYWEGNKLMGKALVLNTPNGNILRGLLEGGVNTGVSLRSAGSLKKNAEGLNEVQDDWKLACWDVVANPSFEAYMNPVMESKEFIYENGQFIELTEEVLDKMGYEKKAKTTPKSNKLDEEKLLKVLEKLSETTGRDYGRFVKREVKDEHKELVTKQVHHHNMIRRLADRLATNNPHVSEEDRKDHDNILKDLDFHVGEARKLHKTIQTK
jgi:hypothetical protein